MHTEGFRCIALADRALSFTRESAEKYRRYDECSKLCKKRSTMAALKGKTKPTINMVSSVCVFDFFCR
jgi:hypothetical protein